MNTKSIQSPFAAVLAALAVLPVFADDPAPAAAAAVPAAAAEASAEPPARDRSLTQPGRSDRAMSPEMKEYVAKLDAIRLERDAQARAVVKADKDIEARKPALAEENEDVKALVDKAAELRTELEETEKALGEVWDADEKIAQLRDARKAAEQARAARQFEMQSAVQAAMRGRAALLGSPDEPEIRSVEAARAAAKEEKPVIKIGGKSMEQFLAEHPTVVVSNLNGRLLAPPASASAPPAPASAPASAE